MAKLEGNLGVYGLSMVAIAALPFYFYFRKKSRSEVARSAQHMNSSDLRRAHSEH
jgi:hypothetical protein